MKIKAFFVIVFLLLMANVAFSMTTAENKALEIEKILAERQPTDRGERIPNSNRAEVLVEVPKNVSEIVNNLESALEQTFTFDVSEHQIMNLEQVIYNTSAIPHRNRAWIGAVKVEAPSDLQLLVDQRSNRYYLYSEQLQEPAYHAAGFFIHEGEALNKVWLRPFYSGGEVKQVISVGIIGESPIYEADYLSITTQAFMYKNEIDGGVLLIFENPFKK